MGGSVTCQQWGGGRLQCLADQDILYFLNDPHIQLKISNYSCKIQLIYCIMFLGIVLQSIIVFTSRWVGGSSNL